MRTKIGSGTLTDFAISQRRVSFRELCPMQAPAPSQVEKWTRGERIVQQLRTFPPVYFSMVMATGIVSIALHLSGMRIAGAALMWLNAALYLIFCVLLLSRLLLAPRGLFQELTNFKLAPAFFTIVAGTSVLSRELLIIDARSNLAAIMLWVAFPLWAGLIYSVFAAFTVKSEKPTLAQGIHGGWLLSVVATQAISVLASVVARSVPSLEQPLLFLALVLWLFGGMLYIWIISLIFYRYTFFPFAPSDLMPPYWINMGAMAISTLAGASLIQSASLATFLQEIAPFLKGLTLFFWATATWWIPMLVILGFWRHVYKRFPLRYDPLYWGAVFPLGMYSVSTRQLCDALHLPFLLWLPQTFVYIAAAAWFAAFVGFVLSTTHELRMVLSAQPPTQSEGWRRS
jgi:tellurite resistance protein TehA-like permease